MREPAEQFLRERERGQLRTVDGAPARLKVVLDAVANPGSITLLFGDPGNGKAYLAEQAGSALSAHLGRECEVFRLPESPHASSGVVSAFSAAFPEVWEDSAGAPADAGTRERLDATRTAAEIWARMVARAAGRECVLIAPGFDEYGPRALAILEQLAQDPALRIIATAHKQGAATEQLGRSPRAHKLSIGPFDLEEADHYLSQLLGVEQIEPETLRRWYAVSRGNAFALAILAFAGDQAGALRRSRGTAWTAEDQDVVPSEFAELVLHTCTPAEVTVLETVALAEPVLETALLRTLHPAALSTLFERGLLVSSTMNAGGALLSVAHPLLAASLREVLTPVRRIQLNDQIYHTLRDELGGVDPLGMPDRLTRIVTFGLEAGQPLPLPWLWSAFELTARGGEPHAVLRLALAVAAHPESEVMQAAAALLLATRLARSVGNDRSLRSALSLVQRLLDTPERSAQLTGFVWCALRLLLNRQLVWDDAPLTHIRAVNAEIMAEAVEMDAESVEQVRAARAVSLAYCGRLRDSFEQCPEPDVSSDLKIEWIRSPARAIAALILEQQGAFARATRSAEDARRLSRLGARAREDYVDLQGFSWLIGHWAGGSADGARQVLAELETDAESDPTAHTVTAYSGLSETGAVLVALQEGRWRDAAQGAERLLDRLARHDSYGVAPLVQAAFALVLAVLGEHDAAVGALRASEQPQRGLGLAMGGHRRVLALRARQWLRMGDLPEHARAVSAWAREEGLALIELQALHIEAFESRRVRAPLVERARELSSAIDPPLGDALVAHIERLAHGVGPAAAETDEPEVRMLAELGIWMPLTPAPGLTAREREVVMLAALGHTSRFIAERLHISARTVETHLSNVFTKLGIDNRDDLWRWAARERSETFSAEADGRDRGAAFT